MSTDTQASAEKLDSDSNLLRRIARYAAANGTAGGRVYIDEHDRDQLKSIADKLETSSPSAAKPMKDGIENAESRVCKQW